MPRSVIVFDADPNTTPDISVVLSRYLKEPAKTSTEQQEELVVEGGVGDDDDEGEDAAEDMDEDPPPTSDTAPNATTGGTLAEAGTTTTNTGNVDDEATTQPPPRKKKKSAPAPLLAPSHFPSFTDYLFAKYSSGVAGGSSDSDGSVSYTGSCYREDEFLDDEELRNEVETELGPKAGDSNTGTDETNSEDRFRVDVLKVTSPKKRGRPSSEVDAGDVEEVTNRYIAVKQAKETGHEALRKLLNYPKATTVDIAVPAELNAKGEVTFTHTQFGEKTVKIPDGVTGTYSVALYPTCDYTLAEKKALHDFSVTYDDFVNVEAEYAKRAMKSKGEFKGYKKREVRQRYSTPLPERGVRVAQTLFSPPRFARRGHSGAS